MPGDAVTLHEGDCLDVLATLADSSVDAVVTDPPYSLAFMSRKWDTFKPSEFQAWCEKWAAECLRVLRPGGHLLAFGGTRTYHRLASGIEDAGLEIRDSIHWHYGSGFPKSANTGRGIDLQVCELAGRHFANQLPKDARAGDHVCPESPQGDPWRGHGTALKPSHEPIVVARKPLAGTVAGNVLEHGTGALNIDGCRVEGPIDPANAKRLGKSYGDTHSSTFGQVTSATVGGSLAGRWPPNILLTHSASCEPAGTRQVRGSNQPSSRGSADGHLYEAGHLAQGRAEMPYYGKTETVEAWSCAPDCPVAELDRQSAGTRAAKPARSGSPGAAGGNGVTGWRGQEPTDYGDGGSASRFFPVFRYQAKAPASERPRLPDGTAWPTVKPLELMRWLVRLVTPPGGTVLDPFAGTGTTAQACLLEGFRCVLIEKDPVALALIRERLSKPVQPSLIA